MGIWPVRNGRIVWFREGRVAFGYMHPFRGFHKSVYGILYRTISGAKRRKDAVEDVKVCLKGGCDVSGEGGEGWKRRQRS